MYMNLNFTCAAATNTFYVVPPLNCTVLAARWVTNADPGSNKTVAISQNGGNDIITGNISTVPGTIVVGTMTSTAADKIQEISSASTGTTSLKIILTTSNVCTVMLSLDLDEFIRKD